MITIQQKQKTLPITSYNSNYSTDAILALQSQEKRIERKQNERNAF